MARVTELRAEPDAAGGRIRLMWRNPQLADLQKVTISRALESYPTAGEGEVATLAGALPGEPGAYLDEGLAPETTYYYAVAVSDGARTHEAALVSAMATANYGSGAALYRMLPAVYRDTDAEGQLTVGSGGEPSWPRYQLRGLLDMTGRQFDLLRSFAAAVPGFTDAATVDGVLLPLLAQWIGWDPNYTLNLARQRNEIRYAPHFYRTLGVPANLRATITRLATWDAQIKEFVHNVFLATHPAGLRIWEARRRAAGWEAARVSTMDAAPGGKLSAALDKGRTWLAYAARDSDRWRVCLKAGDAFGWLPARELVLAGDLDRDPVAIPRDDGSVWLFWTGYQDRGGRQVSGIRHALATWGHAAKPARLRGSRPGPFLFHEGDAFEIQTGQGAVEARHRVVFHAEDFRQIPPPAPGAIGATLEEVAALFERELPGVTALAEEDGFLTLISMAAGASVRLTVPVTPAAAELGLVTGGVPSQADGEDAEPAALSTAGPFAPAPGDRLRLAVDGDAVRVAEFAAETTADQVAAAINRAAPGIASSAGGTLRLASITAGDDSFLAVDGPAAHKLGLGAPPFPAVSDPECEPAAVGDVNKNVWLFWSSLRGGAWNIWFSRTDCVSWTPPARLTSADLEPDREPAAAWDGARVWAFWSHRDAFGQWNIRYRATANLLVNEFAGSAEQELASPPGCDNREPASVSAAGEEVELFFASNRADGWQVWSKRVAPDQAERQVTSGQYTRRAPAVLAEPDAVRLWFRSNESHTYPSAIYPEATTVDARYSGSTTVDTRNPSKIGLRGAVLDAQRYSYNTGKGEMDWYARDVVGIYLVPDSDDERLVLDRKDVIAAVVRRFLPIQVRAVFIVQQVQHESVYTYESPAADPQRKMGEQTVDTILGEAIHPPRDAYADSAGFHWLRTWSPHHYEAGIPDLSMAPPRLDFRLFWKGVDEGG